MGRRTLLTPELEARISADIERGVFESVAAEANGISRATLYRWLEMGEAVTCPLMSTDSARWSM